MANNEDLNNGVLQIDDACYTKMLQSITTINQ